MVSSSMILVSIRRTLRLEDPIRVATLGSCLRLAHLARAKTSGPDDPRIRGMARPGHGVACGPPRWDKFEGYNR